MKCSLLFKLVYENSQRITLDFKALKALKDVSTKTRREFESQTYGVELPDASVLIRRAVTRK
jgi:hypothetical protein